MLADRQAGSAGTYAYFVLDAQGRLVASSRTPQPEPTDLSDTPEFRVHRERRETTLYLGPPRLGRVGYAQGRWIVNASRRIETPDGQFAGVVAAVVSLEHLRRFYDKLRLGEQGAVGLFSAEGVLIARSPWVERFLGQDFSNQAVYREHPGFRGAWPAPT